MPANLDDGVERATPGPDGASFGELVIQALGAGAVADYRALLVPLGIAEAELREDDVRRALGEALVAFWADFAKYPEEDVVEDQLLFRRLFVQRFVDGWIDHGAEEEALRWHEENADEADAILERVRAQLHPKNDSPAGAWYDPLHWSFGVNGEGRAGLHFGLLNYLLAMQEQDHEDSEADRDVVAHKQRIAELIRTKRAD